MLNYLVPRVANVSLRIVAMGSKFALLMVLARLLAPAEVGIYGLFVATVSFSMLIIGGDYYTYSQRELLAAQKTRWSFVLQHQLLAILLLYIVLLPAQAAIFWLKLLPLQLVWWFFALLVVEHIAQELNRLLIVMSKPVLASTILFMRTGVWVWLLLPIMWFKPDFRNLEAVFAAWFLGGSLAIIIGSIIVWREARPWKRWPIDTQWIKRGFGVGLMFLIATLCFRALQTFDRYAVQSLAGPEFLGVYVLYIGMAMSVINILDPAVFSFLYPRLVSTYRQGEHAGYNKVMRELIYSVIAVSVLVAIMIGVIAPFVFEWINKPIYLQYLSILWLLLGMTVVYAIGMVPHYGLYAVGADKSIVFAHISSLFVFGIVLIILASDMPRMATVYALFASFVWMGIFKQWRYMHFRKNIILPITATKNVESTRT